MVRDLEGRQTSMLHVRKKCAAMVDSVMAPVNYALRAIT
jgi:hypothetical protein